MVSFADATAPRMLGRYLIGDVLASGGMAAVHVAQVKGAQGFSRVVAVKRMLSHVAKEASFASMFVDEARLAARVRHPNVVPTFDVVMEGTELCIVMEYVPGLSLAQLLKCATERGEPPPTGVVLAIVRDALEGLHAAHEALDERGHPLGIVHRDVSPQNLLVGADGVARVLDFGIAKANVRLHETRTGDALKGKLGYMAPEQLEGRTAERASDIYAAAVVLWEGLTLERLHTGENEGAIVVRVLRGEWPPPSKLRPDLGTALDGIVAKGLAYPPQARFATAREMATALTIAAKVASPADVSAWVSRVGAALLAERAALVHSFENMIDDGPRAAAPGDAEATAPAIEAWPPPARPAARPGEALSTAAATPHAARRVAETVAVLPPPRASARRALGWLAAAIAVLAMTSALVVRAAIARSAGKPAPREAPSDVPATPAYEPEVTSFARPTTSGPGADVAAQTKPRSPTTARPVKRPPSSGPTQRPAPPAIPDHL